jgi:hypothetical protein
MKTIAQQLNDLCDFESLELTIKNEEISIQQLPNIGVFIKYNDILYFETEQVIKKGTMEQYLEAFLSSPMYREGLQVNNSKVI